MTKIINDQNFTIWKKLFEAALRFKERKPWKHYDDSHVFGVQDPKSNTIGWCLIMGAADTTYGLQVYLGDEGFDSYMNIIDPWLTGLEPDTLAMLQHGMVFNLVNKDETDLVDGDIYQQLGYSFQGNNNYPSFRRMDTGFFPWYLTDEQVVFMTHCLEQTLHAAELGQKNEIEVTAIESEELLVMVPEGNQDELVWSPRMVPHPEPPPLKEYSPKTTMINQLRKKLKKKNATLLLSVQYVFKPIQDRKGEQPYFPKLILWADTKSGLILDTQLTHHNRTWKVFQEKLQSVFKNKGYIPNRIIADSDDAMELMDELAERLRIELIFDPGHPLFKDIQKSMGDFIG